MNKKFTKDNIQLADEYMKKSLDIREMQVKTTV